MSECQFVTIMSILFLIVGIGIGNIIGEHQATNKGGQIACLSINKTWALIDGRYMCVTVTP